MALTTENTDDTSSDEGYVEVERSEIEPTKEKIESVEQEDSKKADSTEASALNASTLEDHNKVMGEEIQECINPSPSNESDADSEAKTKVGAGLLFGLSGLFLGGPILGLLAGLGATYVASDVEGPAGDAARSAGDFAVTTGSKVGEAAKEANEEHGILDKIKAAFSNGWGKVKEFDEEHKIGEKAKDTVSGVKVKTVEFEQKHHVMENILEGIQNGVNFLLGKVRDATSDSNSKSSS